jgi:hypothetical protein
MPCVCLGTGIPYQSSFFVPWPRWSSSSVRQSSTSLHRFPFCKHPQLPYHSIFYTNLLQIRFDIPFIPTDQRSDQPVWLALQACIRYTICNSDIQCSKSSKCAWRQTSQILSQRSPWATIAIIQALRSFCCGGFSPVEIRRYWMCRTL